MKKHLTQCDRIIEYILTFGSISTMDAFVDLGVCRLASRIHDLKREGYDIESETVTGKNRFGEDIRYSVYRLKEKGNGT